MSSTRIFGKTEMPLGNRSYFKRQHIHSLLEEAIKKPAVTVIAGTGFGKTQAVYSFLQESDAITTWMQLSALDNISMRFWSKLVSIISAHNKKLADDLEMIGFPDTYIKVNMLVSFLTRAGDGGKKHIAVFDDLHLITEKRILRLMEDIINAHIPNIHIILISRTEPGIDLASLRVKNMASNIAEDDLRFGREDVDLYYKSQGISLPPFAITKIYDITGGWIFAIRLTELAIKQGVPHEEYAIDAMRLNVFKLMESKFYSDASQQARTLLVKLSLFQSLPSELAVLLAGGDENMLAEALKINSFVRYDSFTNTYCIHHLFLDFLKSKQDTIPPEEKLCCYQAAAGWYSQNGYRIDAINYYGLAAEYDKMLDAVSYLPNALPEEVSALILELLGKAPEEDVEKHPQICILRARARVGLGEETQGIAELDALIEKFTALPPSPGNRLVLCEAYFLKASINHLFCVYTNDYSFKALFAKAYECMPEGSAEIKDRYKSHELGTYVCRVYSHEKEAMDSYIDAIDAVVDCVSGLMGGYMLGRDDLGRAELAYFKGDMKKAESLARRAMHKGRENGQHDIESRALFYLLRIALSTGAYIKIMDVLDQLEAHIEALPPERKMCYDITVGWFYSAIGSGDKTAGWIKSNYVKSFLGALVTGIGNLATIKYFISDKRYDELLAFIDNEENSSGINNFLFGRVTLLANRAVCLYQAGQPDAAIAALRQAYQLSLPNALTMHFIELGNDMVALAKFALKYKDCGIPADWLENIMRKSSTYAKRISFIASEYKVSGAPEDGARPKLTRRELEFLSDLCQGLSAAEIAACHGLSKNYVNNRLQSVYSKLGAHNLKEAIHIATLMKLIK